MRIAVIGAGTALGMKIAKEAYHRHNDVTVYVQDASVLDSVKYEVVRDCLGPRSGDTFDAVIDASGDTVRILKGEKETELVPASEVSEEGRRTGSYELCRSKGEYIGQGDLALAALDLVQSDVEGTVYVRSQRPGPLPQESRERGRYLAVPDRGLAGKVFRFELDSHEEYVAHFISDSRLMFARRASEFETFSYSAFSCDEGVWMVIFMRDDECITLVLDEAQSLVTYIEAYLVPKRTQLVKHRIQFGAILRHNEQAPFKRHAFTDELVGQKITWHYSPYVNITHCFYTEHYMRNSLRSMKAVPEDAPQEARFDAEDRIRRWANIFFEEPAEYIRINPHLYLFCMREANRNRIDPLQGGGDMILAINTRRMRDYGRGFHRGKGAPDYDLVSVPGDWDDMDDPMDTAQSPYLV